MDKRYFLLVFSIIVNFSICSSQNAPDWDKWTWLLGEWTGEGSGEPGQGTGIFSFSFDLDSNILVRKSHSEYPAASGNQKIVHDDLMIVYPDAIDEKTRAVYFDNERHTIFYTVTFSPDNIIMTSDRTGNSPVFRLVYTRLDEKIVNTRFEISQDGIKFVAYVEGKSKKVK